MRIWTAAVWSCWLGVSGLNAAQPPAPPTEQLIEQLSAKDFRSREVAAQALERRGEAALPALRRAQSHADAEVRQRLAGLIARGERAFLIAPKRVTVIADQTPVQQVFADIARQTGYKLTAQQAQPMLVTLRAEGQPFWEVVDAVCRQTGLGLQQHFDNSNTLTFFRVGRLTPNVCYAGPFRIAAASFHHSRTLDLSTPVANAVGRPTTDALTMTITVVGEPKVPLMNLGQPRILAAEDENGQSLVPPQARVYESHYHHYYYGHRNALMQTQVQLLGHGGARTLRHVAGTLPVTMLAEQRPEITIDDILKVKGKKFESGQVVMEIDEVKEQANRQVTVRATARRNAAENQYDYTWTNSLGQRVELFDADGGKYSTDRFDWESGSPTSVAGTFHFGDGGNAKLGKPARLVYYNWITTQHQIAFEFRDLPLP
jgi:hypothetical protein